MTLVDSHMHVWQAAEGPTPGVTTLVPPQIDVPIDQARAVLDANQVARAVLVQPIFRGEDNYYVAACARAEPERFAAVCVVDPRTAHAPRRLEYWVSQGCRGLRLRPSVAEEEMVFGERSTYPLWDAARRLQVVVSVLCGPQHLNRIGKLAERFPEVNVVIDHLGHPDTAAGVQAPTFRELLALARCVRVHVRLSGFYHFCPDPYPFPSSWPLVRAVFDTFGGNRLLWGSDFPHCTVACGYGKSLHVLDEALRDISLADRDAILGRGALSLYWPAS